MKKIIVFTVLAAGAILLYQCKNAATTTLPVLTTASVSGITPTNASAGGNITNDGNATVSSRGVCWSTVASPTVADSKSSDGTGSGSFTSTLTGLSASTEYHVRAYATNSEGTAYGDELTFTSASPSAPVLSTNTVSMIGTTTAMSGGTFSSDGGSAVTAKGVCWSTAAAPTLSDSHSTNGTGSTDYDSDMTGLTSGTLYHVRAYATNSIGTSYGNERTFTTSLPQASNEVSISGMLFNPQTVTVTVNTTVTWTNNDAISHTVTSDTGLFNSGTLTQGGKFSFQFTSAGTFTYHCAFHPDMVGTVIVQ
jgi:plastocyanin